MMLLESENDREESHETSSGSCKTALGRRSGRETTTGVHGGATGRRTGVNGRLCGRNDESCCCNSIRTGGGGRGTVAGSRATRLDCEFVRPFFFAFRILNGENDLGPSGEVGSLPVIPGRVDSGECEQCRFAGVVTRNDGEGVRTYSILPRNYNFLTCRYSLRSVNGNV